LAYQGLEEENLHQKSRGPPGGGVDTVGQPPAHHKKRIAKKPCKWAQEDVNTLYNLLHNNNFPLFKIWINILRRQYSVTEKHDTAL
jgi:hypothetical protein